LKADTLRGRLDDIRKTSVDGCHRFTGKVRVGVGWACPGYGSVTGNSTGLSGLSELAGEKVASGLTQW
jgi:hypothetical protein